MIHQPDEAEHVGVLLFLLVPMFACLHVGLPWKACRVKGGGGRSWNDGVEGRRVEGDVLLRSAGGEEEATPLLVQE